MDDLFNEKQKIKMYNFHINCCYQLNPKQKLKLNLEELLIVDYAVISQTHWFGFQRKWK